MKSAPLAALAALAALALAAPASLAQTTCADPRNVQPPSFDGSGLLLAPASQIIPDVLYCRASGVDLRLDALFPQQSHGPTPAIVFIHGGGWIQGSKESMRGLMRHASARGYFSISVDYRLAAPAAYNGVEPDADYDQRNTTVLEAVQDVNCAFRWLRANAGALNVDPNRIAAFGASAGGHLALMNAYAGDVTGFKGLSDLTWAARQQRAAANVVVNWFGPTNLDHMLGSSLGVLDPITNTYQPVVPYAMHCTPTTCPVLYDTLSPVNWVRAASPPTLTVHGGSDTIVPYSQALELLSASQAVGHPHGIIAVPNAEHVFIDANDPCSAQTLLNLLYAVGVSFQSLDAYLHP